MKTMMAIDLGTAYAMHAPNMFLPPFYSCSECPDFYLHGCCAHLPTRIEHRAHDLREHYLVLCPKAPNSDGISAGFSCKGM